jgi:hypothetical protein
VLLWLPTLTGTSNATTCTLTGLPAAITPTQQSLMPGAVGQDNGVAVTLIVQTAAGSGTLTLSLSPGGTAFTNSGTKLMYATWLSYALL